MEYVGCRNVSNFLHLLDLSNVPIIEISKRCCKSFIQIGSIMILHACRNVVVIIVVISLDRV